MNNNLLFSKEKSEELDKLAQEIDPRLILFCDYTPIEQYSSNEAGFILGCLNLYKCTVDGMLLWSKLRDEKSCFVQHLPTNGLETLKTIEKQQAYLRSIFAHNNCADSGEYQYRRIRDYEDWLLKATGKKQLLTESEYGYALNELKNIGNSLYDVLHVFLSNLKSLIELDKEVVVYAWIEVAADWYSKKKYYEIYKGMLNNHIWSRQDCARMETATAMHILIGNALKEESDRTLFNQIGIENPFGLKRKLLTITAEVDDEKEKTRIIQKFREDLLPLDIERKTYYEEIDSYEDLHPKWQETLFRQLINRANAEENTNIVGFLAPTNWLDDHINYYLHFLSAERKTHEYLMRPPK